MAEIIGDNNLYLSPVSQVVNAENESVTFNYVGGYDNLINRVPKKDFVWRENGVMYTVLSSSVTHHAGGMGEMSVTCIPYKVGSAGDATSDHFEIQFVETSQQLAFHENFPSDSVEQWKMFLLSPEYVQQQNKYCPNPGDEETTQNLTGDIIEWARLYNKGIREYMIYLPVVIRVRTYNLSPEREVSNVGKLQEPEVVPSGFSGGEHWLKTGDNSVQEPGSGKWTRTETYASEWPSLLYD